MMRAILVDDSPRGLKTLQALLSKFCPQVEVVGTAGSVAEAFPLLVNERPDLIFLDIEMPGGNGFELLEKAQPLNIPFQVIFVTAFNQYALKAIKFSALDYLLKPVDHQELISAVAKAEQSLTKETFQQRYLTFLENYRSEDKDLQKLALPTHQGYKFIPIQEIIRCEGDGNYIRVYLLEGRPILASRRLKEVEDLLDNYRFLRIHRSHLINLRFVQQYQRGEGGIVKMVDGSELNVSRSRKEALLASLRAG